VPRDGRVSEKMRDFIRLLLVPDPRKRPNIKQIISMLEQWEALDVKLPPEALEIKRRQEGVGQKENKTLGKDRDLTAADIAELQQKLRAGGGKATQ